MSQANARSGGVRKPDLDTMYTINSDGSRNFLHPADVQGRWQVRKNVIWSILLVIYLGLPFVKIGGHPAVLFDIGQRAAHLFGGTFTNQDFYLIFFLLLGFGLTLFVATSLYGRVWCGFACPQTVFMEGVFRRIERWIEGPRGRRIQRNLGPLTGDKFLRKALKHMVFIALCWIFAHAFIAYFMPVENLLEAVRRSPASHMPAFIWGMAWTGVLYFNYAWFREQTCLIICPYGRLQSTLIDPETIIIGYDERRGEPRGQLNKEGNGDCIDCLRCVNVCPTGIDIRNGLQMECIACSNCVDACDTVMDKIGKPRGLIRYDSQRGFAGERRKPLRARLLVYLVAALVGVGFFAWQAGERTFFQVGSLRARGLPYTLTEDGVRNLYTIFVQNKSDEDRTFLVAPDADVAVLGDRAEFIVPQDRVRLAALGEARVPLFVTVPRADYSAPQAFHIAVTDSATGTVQRVQVRFLGP
ncbi:MAG: cytochrome c oxidase accessory protein CcoG [Candidatus Krumholzibacteriia bacterium]